MASYELLGVFVLVQCLDILSKHAAGCIELAWLQLPPLPVTSIMPAWCWRPAWLGMLQGYMAITVVSAQQPHAVLLTSGTVAFNVRGVKPDPHSTPTQRCMACLTVAAKMQGPAVTQPRLFSRGLGIIAR